MLHLTLKLTLMSRFGLPGTNNNVTEERIEWDNISSRLGSNVLETRLMNILHPVEQLMHVRSRQICQAVLSTGRSMSNTLYPNQGARKIYHVNILPIYVCMQHAIKLIQLPCNSDIAVLNLTVNRRLPEIDSQRYNSQYY